MNGQMQQRSAKGVAGWFDRFRVRPRPVQARQQPSLGDQDVAQFPTRSESPSAAAAERPATFPRFRSTAGDQLAERHGNASLHLRLRNAYTPSQPVTDRRLFAGRSHILRSLIRAIEDERLHAVVYGERGIGKTSSMHVVAQAARDARYIAPYVSCGPSSTFDETFPRDRRRVAAALSRPVRTDLRRGLRRQRDVHRSAPRNRNLGSGGQRPPRQDHRDPGGRLPRRVRSRGGG